MNRVVAIERAVRVYYDSTGRYPQSLEDLVVAGILDEDALRDPYGRFYRYILRAEDGKFGLYGRNARGQIDLDLSLERSLAPVSELRPAASRPSATSRAAERSRRRIGVNDMSALRLRKPCLKVLTVRRSCFIFAPPDKGARRSNLT